ncbi:MAG: hypothetical protein QXQ53_05675 [Candidatus Methanosuratincola sp.]
MNARSFYEYVSTVDQARFTAKKRAWLYKPKGHVIKMRSSAKRKYRATLAASAIAHQITHQLGRWVGNRTTQKTVREQPDFSKGKAACNARYGNAYTIRARIRIKEVQDGNAQ